MIRRLMNSLFLYWRQHRRRPGPRHQHRFPIPFLSEEQHRQAIRFGPGQIHGDRFSKCSSVVPLLDAHRLSLRFFTANHVYDLGGLFRRESTRNLQFPAGDRFANNRRHAKLACDYKAKPLVDVIGSNRSELFRARVGQIDIDTGVSLPIEGDFC